MLRFGLRGWEPSFVDVALFKRSVIKTVKLSQ
jgi:hypothetical protein